jgi:hypothetical protein
MAFIPVAKFRRLCYLGSSRGGIFGFPKVKYSNSGTVNHKPSERRVSYEREKSTRFLVSLNLGFNGLGQSFRSGR